ncbi:hypothetical protein Dimus_002147 [Dionaea muscipula]
MKMKLSNIGSISAKNIFGGLKKTKSAASSVTRSDTHSLSVSSSDYSSSSHGHKRCRSASTPTSVLPQPPPFRSSGDLWSDGSGEAYLELQEAFKIIDHNGDGKISKTELMELFLWIGPKEAPTDEEITEMMKELDTDGDGCISFDEFRAIGSAFGPALDVEELRETFEVFDADHDGKITAEELHKVFSAIGDDRCTLEECRRMIMSVDVNRDGFVCFEDFKHMMEHQTFC